MIVDKLTNKRVSFKYHGTKSQFDLSLGLFSSFDIDIGTRLLLKTIAKEVDFTNIISIADIGCGVGSLSIPLLIKHKNTSLFAADRDALALKFTKHNAELNKIDKNRISYNSSLLFDDFESEKKFNLIISNIPAKIGEPALKNFFDKSIMHLSNNGIVSVVIVNPLLDKTDEILKDKKFKVIYKEIGKGHTVFHYTIAAHIDNNNASKSDNLGAHYIRIENNFPIGSCNLPMKRVYNLPNFDIPSYRLQLSVEILQFCDMGNRQLYIDPVQGHLPLFLNFDRWPKEIHLASRDLLQLKVSKENLFLNGFNGIIETNHISDITDLIEKYEKNSFDQMFIDSNPISKTEWYSDQRNIADRLIKSKGNYFTCGKSSDMYHIVKNNKGFTAIDDKKYRGERAILYKKN